MDCQTKFVAHDSLRYLNGMPAESQQYTYLHQQLPGKPGFVPVGHVGGTTYFYPAEEVQSDSSYGSTSSSSGNVSLRQSPVSRPPSTKSVTTDFYPAGTNPAAVGNQPLRNVPHTYTASASSTSGMQPSSSQHSSALCVAVEYRTELLRQQECSHMVRPAVVSGLPDCVEKLYHSLLPVEDVPMETPSSTYRVTSTKTGTKYCMRRLHNTIVQSARCMIVADAWRKVKHPNVTILRHIFTTKVFRDKSFIFVYDFHPNSQTMMAKYFTPAHNPHSPHQLQTNRQPCGPLLPETEIWDIVMQLTAGLQAMHENSLACRTLLDPTKIIFTGKRLRYSFIGITNMVERYDASKTKHYKQEDLTALGKMILALCTRSLYSMHEDQIEAQLNTIGHHYSNDLRNLLFYLLQVNQPLNTKRCITDLMPMIGDRFYDQLDSLQCSLDVQEDVICKESANGRLFRLVLKLGMINKRPEPNLDVMWSETGDRYMLKLYRDYLMHSVTDDGRHWLDHAHIVQSLNKLDAGVMEKVQLMSRDMATVMVVTYAELKHCLEMSFSELSY